MKRLLTLAGLFALALLLAPPLRADVMTRQKSQVKFEGFLGTMVNLFGGKAAKEGVTSTVAVKGDRMSDLGDATGRIIDLGEEKVYALDLKKKQYQVKTFAELRAEYEKAKAEAEQRASEMKQDEKQEAEQPEQEYEFDVAVKETGEHKSILGQDTREAVITITGHVKGQSLEDGGGLVLTADSWIGPAQPALREIVDFNLKFIKAIYGEQFMADMQQQMATLLTMYPSFSRMSAQMQASATTLQGTPLETTTTFEVVKSAEQLKAAQQESQSSGGGGLGGMLGRKLMGNRGQPQQRSTVFTAAHQVLSVSASASADDVAIPAGFKEKK